MKHYTCIAHQAFKESCIYFYKGTYTTKELEDLTIKKVKEETDDKDPDIYVDYILESNSPIKFIYF